MRGLVLARQTAMAVGSAACATHGDQPIAQQLHADDDQDDDRGDHPERKRIGAMSAATAPPNKAAVVA